MTAEQDRPSLREATQVPDIDYVAKWQDVEARIERKRNRWIVPVSMGGALVPATAALLLVLVAPDHDPASLEPRIVTLNDGSTVTLEGDTSLEVLNDGKDRIRVTLGLGDGLFEVSKRPERRFEISAGDVEIRVIGTRFLVSRTAEGPVTVRVYEGIVEIEADGQTTRIGEGESWAEPDVTTPLAVQRVEAQEPIEEPEAKSPGASLAPSPVPATPRPAFDEARSASQQGRYADAVSNYERFLRENPNDPRAAWVVFEIARLS
ncbi:MAG: FecR domain-containing protein, partial [Myxococcota bacterium]